jgi:DNA-binding NarL/FixJ family response regulator
MRKITVLLADDHTMVREGFRKLLELDEGLEVVGEASDGRQAVALVGQLQPAVVLMDIGMPLLNGLEATRQILKAFPATKVLMLTAHNDDATVKNAMDSGAVGFLLKQTSTRDVCRAVREIQNGKSLFSPPAPKSFDRLRAPPPDRPGWVQKRRPHLTSREMEVVQLVAEGKSNKETAAVLGVSIKTIEKHRGHVMKKLDIHETAGLTRYAINAGIIRSNLHSIPVSG